jgi:hypothetical protein
VIAISQISTLGNRPSGPLVRTSSEVCLHPVPRAPVYWIDAPQQSGGTIHRMRTPVYGFQPSSRILAIVSNRIGFCMANSSAAELKPTVVTSHASSAPLWSSVP